jgi:hypothetical protein
MILQKTCSTPIKINQYHHVQVTTIVPFLDATNRLFLSVINNSNSHQNGKRVAGSFATNTVATISPEQVDAIAFQKQHVSSSGILQLK